MIGNNNFQKCQVHQIHSVNQGYISTNQAQPFILTLTMSLGGARMTMLEGKRKRKGWMRGLDTRGRSSESNTTKKIKLRVQEINNFSSRQVKTVIERPNNQRKAKRNSQKANKNKSPANATTSVSPNPNPPPKSSNNSNSAGAKSSANSVFSANGKKQTRTYQFSCCSCWP